MASRTCTNAYNVLDVVSDPASKSVPEMYAYV